MDGETGLDSMPIVDARGGGSDLIRSLGLPLGVWCVPTAGDLDAAIPFAMLAVYSGDELDRAHTFMKRMPTLVIGVGTGYAILRAQWRRSRTTS